MPRGGRRTVLVAGGAAAILLFGLAAVFWKNLQASFHLHRLHKDPACFAEALLALSDSTLGDALRGYLQSSEGRTAAKVEIRIQVYRRRGGQASARLSDADNLIASVKHILDALKKLGWLYRVEAESVIAAYCAGHFPWPAGQPFFPPDAPSKLDDSRSPSTIYRRLSGCV